MVKKYKNYETGSLGKDHLAMQYMVKKSGRKSSGKIRLHRNASGTNKEDGERWGRGNSQRIGKKEKENYKREQNDGKGVCNRAVQR